VGKEKVLTFLSSEITFKRVEDCQSGPCLAKKSSELSVIIDFNRMRAEITIPMALFDLSISDDPLYHSALDSRLFSLIQSESLTFAKDNDSETYNLSSITTTVKKRFKGFLNWGLSSSEAGGYVNEAFISYRKKKHEYSLGLINSNHTLFPLSRDIYIQGLSVKRKFNLRKDYKNLDSNPIRTFIERRSLVKMFLRDQLISVKTYDAGFQSIPTSELPAGVYTIKLVVTDEAQNSTEELHDIVKSSLLPPDGKMPWIAEVGQVMINDPLAFLPVSANQQMLRLGAAKKITKNNSVTAGATITGKNFALEVGARNMNPYGSLTASVGMNSEGFAVDLGATLQKGNKFLRIKETYGDISIAKSVYNNQQETVRHNSLVQVGQTLLGGQVSATIERKTDGETTNNVVSVEFNKVIDTQGRGRLRWTSSLAKDNEGMFFNLGLSYDFSRMQDYYRAAASIFKESANAKQETQMDISANWKSPFEDELINDTRFSFQASKKTLKQSFSAGMSSEKEFGTAELNIKSSTSSQDESQSFQIMSGRLATVVSIIGDQYFWGGGSAINSGIMVKVASDSENQSDLSYQIKIDGQIIDNIQNNSSKLVRLRPYDTHLIELKPQGSVLTEAKIIEREIFTLPGSIEMLEVKPVLLKTIVTNIVDDEGVPVKGLRILGGSSIAYSDDEGFLQVEVEKSKNILKARRRNGEKCEINLPASSSDLIYIEHIVCKAIVDKSFNN